MIKDEVQMFSIHEGHLQVDNKRSVEQQLEHVFLSHHCLCLLLFDEVNLRKLFDRNKLLRFFVQREVDLTKGALTNLLVELKVIDTYLLCSIVFARLFLTGIHGLDHYCKCCL